MAGIKVVGADQETTRMVVLDKEGAEMLPLKHLLQLHSQVPLASQLQMRFLLQKTATGDKEVVVGAEVPDVAIMDCLREEALHSKLKLAGNLVDI